MQVLWDSTVKHLKDGLITDLHSKHADRDEYFHFTSFYPGHTKQAIVYSLAF